MKTFPRTVLFFSAAAIFCLVSFAGISPLAAAGQVEIQIEGVEGDILKNLQAALALPEGIVTDGKVNLLWLDYFRLKAADKIRTAVVTYKNIK